LGHGSFNLLSASAIELRISSLDARRPDRVPVVCGREMPLVAEAAGEPRLVDTVQPGVALEP
jgi:hypothetical protein